jgi:hypothetical protein
MPDLDPIKSECCGVGDNLEVEKAAETSSSFVKTFRCKVCGRRHYRMTVKPIEINLSQVNK